MKKKQINLLLGVIVLITWGGGAYRIFNSLNASDDFEDSVPVNMKKERANDYAPVADTSQLRLNYGDPFEEEKRTVKMDTATVKKPALRHAAARSAAVADLSFIKFAGFINNPASKHTLVILVVNGRTATLNEGESAFGIKVLKNLRDSVKIVYQNHVRYIARS